MKKIVLFLTVLCLSAVHSYGQKYAFVDTDYILNSIPTYESAQDQLELMSEEWQQEIEAKYVQIEKLYKEFQAEKVLLTEEMRAQREEEIIEKEREVKDLQRKYFGPEGELFKKRTELIEPIQTDIFNAVKEIATDGNYAVIFDAAGGTNMLYSDPKYDKSDDVLQRLGFKN